jgi:two-component system chemotaxis response regulator CheB
MGSQPRAQAAPVQFGCIGVASSLGGPAALARLLPALPAYFPVPIVVGQHRAARAADQFAETLNKRCRLDVRLATDGEALGPGVTLAPSGWQPSVGADGLIHLTERQYPPTDADVLFTSLAAAYGARAIVVVLTGALSDGAAGVRAVKRRGGRVLVQHPDEAAAAGMPNAALATGCVDLALPLDTIGPALVALSLAPGGASLLSVPVPPWADLRSAG